MLCRDVGVVVPNNAYVVSDECNAFWVLCGISYIFLKKYLFFRGFCFISYKTL